VSVVGRVCVFSSMSAGQAVFSGWMELPSSVVDEEASNNAADEIVAALVTTYAGTLYRVAFSVLRNAADAEDAVQEAFVRVLRHREMCIRDRSYPSAVVHATPSVALPTVSINPITLTIPLPANTPQTFVIANTGGNAVSYTHLDVYKRQVRQVGPRCARNRLEADRSNSLLNPASSALPQLLFELAVTYSGTSTAPASSNRCVSSPGAERWSQVS